MIELKTIKIRYLIICAVILQFSLLEVNGQTEYCCSLVNSLHSDPALPGELFHSAVQIDSKTWFNNDWLLADIKLSNGEYVKNKYLKYNGLIDEVFWREPKSGKIIKLDKGAVQYFHFLRSEGDTSVNFKRIKVRKVIGTDSTEIYGEEIFHGKLSLYVLHAFYVEKSEVMRVNKDVFIKDFYVEKPIYYFRFINNKTVGIKKINRQSLYQLTPGKKEQINRYFRENKPVRADNKSHLRKLTEFLGSIIY